MRLFGPHFECYLLVCHAVYIFVEWLLHCLYLLFLANLMLPNFCWLFSCSEWKLIWFIILIFYSCLYCQLISLPSYTRCAINIACIHKLHVSASQKFESTSRKWICQELKRFSRVMKCSKENYHKLELGTNFMPWLMLQL